jgi:hypothetical protein
VVNAAVGSCIDRATRARCSARVVEQLACGAGHADRGMLLARARLIDPSF